MVRNLTAILGWIVLLGILQGSATAGITYTAAERKVSALANGVLDSEINTSTSPSIWSGTASSIRGNASAAAHQVSLFAPTFTYAISDLNLSSMRSSDTVYAESLFDVTFELEAPETFDLKVDLLTLPTHFPRLARNANAAVSVELQLLKDDEEFLRYFSEFKIENGALGDIKTVEDVEKGVLGVGKYQILFRTEGTASGYLWGNVYSAFWFDDGPVLVPEPASVMVWSLFGLMIMAGRYRRRRS